MIWFLSFAVAYPSGIFLRRESAEEVKQAQSKALEQTLAASSFWVRKAARKRLAESPYSCLQYRIRSHEDHIQINCDQRPTFTLRLDGQPTTYKDKKVDILSITPNRIEQYVGNEKGGMKIIYTFSKDMLTVQKIISSHHLGKDLSIQNTYQYIP